MTAMGMSPNGTVTTPIAAAVDAIYQILPPHIQELLAPYKQLLPAIFAALIALVLGTFALGGSAAPKPKGKKLGIAHSNLSDEYTYDPAGLPDWRVKSLWVYPIKSCKGVEVNEVKLVPTGFEHDRNFTFAEKREKGWVFVTQRQYPLLARVSPELYTHPDGDTLVVSFPSSTGALASTVYFTIPLKDLTGHPKEDVHIWKETIPAYNVSGRIAKELKSLANFLGSKHEIGLFHADPESPRPVFRCAPKKEELGHQPVVGFTDAYPLHIINLHSIRDLHERLPDVSSFSANRFRANIIVTGPPAYDEDDWKTIKIEDDVFYAACRTVRCKLPNVDQETGVREKSGEPDNTMREYRDVDEGAPGKACMGLQLVPKKETGVVTVNTTVEVVERGEHKYIPQ